MKVTDSQTYPDAATKALQITIYDDLTVTTTGPMADGNMAGWSPVIGTRTRLDLYANVRKVKLLPGVRHRITGVHKQVWEAGDVDMVIIGTPIDLTRILKINKPIQRVRYELQEMVDPR